MTLTVAKHEFLFTVKRPAFLIATFGMPVFAFLYVGIIAMIGMVAAPAAKEVVGRRIGIVDEADLIKYVPNPKVSSGAQKGRPTLRITPQDVHIDNLESLRQMSDDVQRFSEAATLQRFRQYDNIDDALAAMKKGKVKEVIVISNKYIESGEIKQYTKKWHLFSSVELDRELQWLLNNAFMYRKGWTEDEVRRITKRPTFHVYEKSSNGEFAEVNKIQRGIDIGIPLAVIFTMLLSLVINAGFLSSGIAEEKENKMLENFLSSVTPRELLMGKVLGLGAAALLQLCAWFLMVGIVPVLLLSVLKQNAVLEFKPILFLFGAIFFIEGFLFYGTLLVGFGSLGNNLKECQQLAVLVVLIPMLPMFLMIPILFTFGDTLWTRIMSFVPFFTPGLMMVRLGLGSVSLWELIASVIVLAASAWIAVLVSARLFKVGMLMTGKPFNLIAVTKMFFQR